MGYHEPARDYVLDNRWVFWVAFLLSIIALFALIFAKGMESLVAQTGFLLIFVGMESVLVGVICAIYYENGAGEIILTSFGLTMVVFSALSLLSCFLTCVCKMDFSWMGQYLLGILLVLLFWGFINIFFGFKTRRIWSLLVGILFCLYIIYDT